MNKSEKIGKLTAALSKFQGEVRDPVKERKGYKFDFANLSDLLKIARPLLKQYGLAVMQLICTGEENLNSVGIETVLAHSYEDDKKVTHCEWMSTTMYMPINSNKGGNISHAFGEAVTYNRRYALAALLGITQSDTDCSEEESSGDGGNGRQSNRVASRQSNNVRKFPPGNTGEPRCATGNLRHAIGELKVSPTEVSTWLKRADVSSIEELNPDQTSKLMDMLKERQGGK